MIAGLVAILTVGLRVASGGGPADPGADDKKEPVGSVVEISKLLEDHIGHIDWEAEGPFIEQAIERFWERNGWTAEPDLATRDLACEVAAIPPWQMMKRLDLMCQRVGERYDYSPAQAAQFKGTIMRETSSWLTRHAGTIFEHIRGGLPVAAQAEPADPEQVARWTKATEALVSDVRGAFYRVVEEIRPTFTSEQNEILEPDLRAFDKRWKDVQQLRARWAAGGWRPDDWGIPADSDLRPSLADVEPEPARLGSVSGEVTSTPVVTVVPKWVAHDPSTWFAYVLETAKRYDLNPGQMTAAWSVHAEIVSRANAYILAHADRLQPVPISARSTHVVYGPIRLLFEELKDRLEVIPTTAQRAVRAS